MRPKKIYLNYEENSTDEEIRDNATWSEQPVAVTDCDMVNAEYADLGQIWHEPTEIPEVARPLLVERKGRLTVYSQFCVCTYSVLTETYFDGFTFIMPKYIKRWAYLSAILPKGGEE